MDLRIHRSYEWYNVSKMIGGRPKWECRSIDTLQFFNGERWADVPIFEAEKPINPDELRRKEQHERFAKSLKNALDKATEEPNKDA